MINRKDAIEKSDINRINAVNKALDKYYNMLITSLEKKVEDAVDDGENSATTYVIIKNDTASNNTTIDMLKNKIKIFCQDYGYQDISFEVRPVAEDEDGKYRLYLILKW